MGTSYRGRFIWIPQGSGLEMYQYVRVDYEYSSHKSILDYRGVDVPTVLCTICSDN